MMVYLSVLTLALLTLLSGCAYNPVSGSLNDQLSDYDVLRISPINSQRHKRDAKAVRNYPLEFKFEALRRRFHLYLQRRTTMPILLPGFEIFTVDGFGKEERVDVDLSNFYEGALVDERTSWAQATFHSGKLFAMIESQNETFVIEPASPFLKNASEEEVIVYKGSNLKVPRRNFCGFVRANFSNDVRADRDLSGASGIPTSRKIDTRTRMKRSVSDGSDVKDTCGILLVADYRFYTNIGQSNVATTSRILIELLDRVNRIYRPTVFTDSQSQGLSGYGFGIKRIHIHTQWYQGSQENHYNRKPVSDTDVWSDRELLSAFDREDYSDYCLAHLFTYQKFGAGTLGLAYIASDRAHAPGGVCSPRQNCQSYYCSINTGWTTFQDSSGDTLVTLESHLVTSHELGHNMGSSHDPDTPECSPPPEKNGKYLMYQYSVTGFEPNNNKFSPCSRRAIGRVLEKKADLCFERRQKSFCGNNRQEGSEECDAGSSGLQGSDPCCTPTCKLKQGMNCSPANHACCTSSCKTAPRDKLCAHKDVTSPCEGDAYCDGVSFACPLPQPLNNVTCGIRGVCRNRTCIPYCERIGMIPCQCHDIEDACFMCCRKTLKDHCEPVTPQLVLKDGLPCVQGMCSDGKCKKRVSMSIERFWQIIIYLDANEIGKMMWKNIVGSIIVLSLLVWIPASCFISYFDRQKEKGKI